MTLLAELQRRKVFKVGAAYLVVAWLAVQAASIGFPAFDAPPWALRVFILISLLGFPIAVVMAWVFDSTPEGVKLDARGIGSKLVFAGATVLVALAMGWYFYGQPLFRKLDATAPATKAVPAAAPAASDKSIAVLPFENLSGDKANAYFATGMQDEILTRLAGIRDLKVISRTSTAKYDSHPDDLKTVGQQLGVATVLEGSVQKAGDAVHINVQLIDAQSDGHLWAVSYDRDLKDIFGVERDVAEKVAEALKAKLLPAETALVAQIPTQDTEAYDLYLRANAQANRANEQSIILVAKQIPPAITQYQQALAKDPNFAVAAAALANAQMQMYWFAPDRSEARLESAKAAAEHALALQPHLGEGHIALALYHYWGHRDYAQALQQLQLARKSLPNSADVEFLFAVIARRQGQWSEAITGFERAVVLDPRSTTFLDQLGWTYSRLHRYANADQAFARAADVTLEPAVEQVQRGLNAVAWKGDLVRLRAALSALEPDSAAFSGNARNFFLLEWWSRNFPVARKMAETNGVADWADENNVELPSRLYFAWAYATAGDSDRAKDSYAAVLKQMRTALVLRPDDADLHLALGFAAAGAGLTDEAVREGRTATGLMPISRDALSGASHLGWLAQLYVRVGETDHALDLLQQLLAMPAGNLISPALLKLDPVWDPLRKIPRFQKLIADADDDAKGQP